MFAIFEFTCIIKNSYYLGRCGRGRRKPLLQGLLFSPSRSTSLAPTDLYLPTMPPKKKTSKNADAAKTNQALADTNHDGRVSRSEAQAAHLSVSAADTNDDGRVTRSEARRMRDLRLGEPEFLSLE